MSTQTHKYGHIRVFMVTDRNTYTYPYPTHIPQVLDDKSISKQIKTINPLYDSKPRVPDVEGVKKIITVLMFPTVLLQTQNYGTLNIKPRRVY